MQNQIHHHRDAYSLAKKQLEFINPRTGTKEYVVNRDPNPADKTEMGARRINVTESVIRTRNKLNQAITNYSFGILDNQPSSQPAGTGNSNNYPLEVRLAMQDVFFVYGLGFYLYIIDTPGGNGSYEYQPCTFPNPNLYGAGSGAVNLDQMTQLWTAGNLNVTINKNILTTSWGLQRHYKINQTQIPPINSNPPVGDAPYFNQVDLREDGMVPVEPNWILNGGNQNIFQINYPNPLNNIGLGVGSSNYHIELYMIGFLAQNASSIMNNS